jgi:hypothetical protein
VCQQLSALSRVGSGPEVSDASEDPRVTIVNEHMRLENEHDFAGCIAEFSRAR